MPSGKKRSTLSCGMMKQSRTKFCCAARSVWSLDLWAISSGLIGVLDIRVLGGGPPGGLAEDSRLGDRPGGPTAPGGGGRNLGGPLPFIMVGSQLPC